MLILRNLLVRRLRFNELKKNLAGISQKVLSDSLRSMEEDGLVAHTVTVIPGGPNPGRIPADGSGESLRSILDAIQRWGEGV